MVCSGVIDNKAESVKNDAEAFCNFTEPKKQFFRMLLFWPRLEAIGTCTRVEQRKGSTGVRLADKRGVNGKDGRWFPDEDPKTQLSSQ